MERQAVRTALLALVFAAGAMRAEAAPPKAPEQKPASQKPRAPSAGLPGSLPEARPVTGAGTAPKPAHDSAVSVDPKRGQGQRRVAEPVVSAAPRGQASDASRASSTPKAATPALKRAPAPASVSAERRAVAGGPTKDDLAASRPDPELSSLRAAELALFPRPLPGVVPGWSWDLPRPIGSNRPEVVSGAPSSTRFAPAEKTEIGRDPAWLRGLSLPNLPVRFEQRVLQYLTFYRENPSGRAIARAWAKKIGRYGPALRTELAKAGLPSDLVCLSLIESGHNPTIVSPAGAAGLWQFMPDAGRAYGLAIDRWIDERLDPVRATEAAARMLSDLYRRFGSWDLAMAAYNMGHGGLGRAIRKYNSNDYWELARYEAGIPWETTLYVPKILATAITLGNRRTFGLEDVQEEPGESVETVLVAPGISLDAVARLAGVSGDLIESLNPQFLAGRTPPSPPGTTGVSYRLRVPLGKAAAVQAGLARVALEDESYRPHLVRRGETLETIALARGTTEAQLRLINRVDPKEVLVAGNVLLVPDSASAREPDPGREVVVVPPRPFQDPKRRRVFYRVLGGDSIERLAEVFGVTRAEILLWNAIDDHARLQADMTLQLFVPKERDLSRVRHLSDATARVLVAGSPEFCDYFEGQNGKRRLVIRAKKGDSLAEIGKRYGMTIGWMERVNRRARNEELDPGAAIVVYTDRARPAPGDMSFEEPQARLASDVRSAAAPAPAAPAVWSRASAD
jgi:membrane-bound lytic murein transglycosylase D